VQGPIATGRTLNRPANLATIHHFVAAMLGTGVEALSTRIGENFARLFGGR
jgi:hypothetical protein